MSIPFTRYLLPDGRKRQEYFAPDDKEVERKALQLIAEKKYCFDIEMLSTGIISLTCMDTEDETVSYELSTNGPEIVGAVTRLVERAYSSAYPDKA